MFKTRGKYNVGCRPLRMNALKNRGLLFYPVDKKYKNKYKEPKWNLDDYHFYEGFGKMTADLVPNEPIRFLNIVTMDVKWEAPIAPEIKNVTPIIFSHGVGGTLTMYSCLLRELASRGYAIVVFEHRDGTALYYHNNETEEPEYMNF